MMPSMNNQRRQNEYQYANAYPPQQNPALYYPQQYYPQAHVHPHPVQWHPQQAYYQQGPRQYNNYYQHPPPIPNAIPQQHVPMVVSSQPHAQTPLQGAPTTPSVASLPRQSPAPSYRSEHVVTRPPSEPASRPTTAVDPTILALAEVGTGKMAAERPLFHPLLPWLSVPEQPFPPPARRRRKRTQNVALSAAPLELPDRLPDGIIPDADDIPEAEAEAGDITEAHTESQTSTVAAPSEQETPATSHAPSEADEQPATPLPATPLPASSGHTRTPTRPVVPIVPKVALPHVRKPSVAPQSDEPSKDVSPKSVPESSTSETTSSSATLVADTDSTEPAEATPPPPAPKGPPKLWADLVRTKVTAASAANPSSSSSNGVMASDRIGAFKTGTLAESIRAYSVDTGAKVSFLKPRGLVNSGNMCYMNSVLQTLAFCVPFYDFIDLVAKRVAHSFKSDTPLLDSMIFFMSEFPVIDAAPTVEQLRLRLKNDELEHFGDAFTPENVYDAIKRLPRFASMRRGHQQDAEEFLIFLLETLHDECVRVINSVPISSIDAAEPASPVSERSSVAEAGWQEVGPKQKASTTHTSGHSYNDTPITKIFGGTLRSELRVPGKKNSVTIQPYQPLQLDIGAPEVHNIVDALKGLTRSETIHGDFDSPRGPDVAATKQIFIDTLPPVLILHLKRFEYNNAGGTQKIWKKVGYPLELTIPKEVFPQAKRGQLAITGLPKYRLEGVIYHHGKNAGSGHYTVDVRRQEGKEWIRLDDTIIRRLRAEDVAEAGAEEDPKVLAKALEAHKKEATSSNMFDQFGAVEDEDASSESGWNTAGPKDGSAAKKWSAVANGVATPSSAGAKTPTSRREGVRDNKVAYILFYRRI